MAVALDKRQGGWRKLVMIRGPEVMAVAEGRPQELGSM